MFWRHPLRPGTRGGCSSLPTFGTPLILTCLNSDYLGWTALHLAVSECIQLLLDKSRLDVIEK
ncbi:hypothetical protein BgiBS90_014958, partial [Biomphalaria glabrata]